MARLRLLPWLSFVGTTALAGPAAAQSNFGSELLGGAGFVMGGTGAAVGSDPTVPLLNPARLTHVPDKSFGISRFIHGRIHLLDDFYDPQRDGLRATSLDPDVIDSDTFELDMLLGGLCFTTDLGTGPDERDPDDRWFVEGHAGHHQVGLCAMPTELDSFAATALHTAPSPSVEGNGTVFGSWVRRSVGLGWGWNITDDLSVGLSAIVGIARYREATVGSSVFFDASTPTITSFQLDASGRSFELIPHAGVSYRISEHTSLGAAVRLPSIHLDGSWTSTRVRSNSLGPTSRASENGSLTTRVPPRVVLSGAIHYPKLRAEIMGSYYFGQDEIWAIDNQRTSLQNLGGATDPGFPDRRVERSNPIANLGVGLEWVPFEQLGFITGISTDLSAAAPLRPEGLAQRILYRRLDRYHFGGGFTFYGDVGQLITAARLTYGQGELRSTDPLAESPSVGVVSDTELAFIFHIAGRVDLPAIAGSVLSF